MLNALKQLLLQNNSPTASQADLERQLVLAAAALLVEISRADAEIDQRETEAVIDAVRTVFTIGDEELKLLLADAGEAVEQAVSLYEFTNVINEQFDAEKKSELMTMLWRVAYADGSIDRYEEYYIRKIADLLHLSHSVFIRTKLAAAQK
ncbi:MAG: TerB family tellurite resistance protein [Pseudomonadota bacterium]